MLYRLLSLAATLIIMLGFVLPYLFSAANSELVLMGVAFLIATVYVVVTQISKIVEELAKS